MGQPRAGSAREASVRPAPPARPWWGAGGEGGRRCVTPRQTCPQPNGLGRNLRSKTRWFTGFCNSHQVSHFATFFIDARAEISIAESRYRLQIERRRRPRAHRVRGGGGALSRLFSLARSAPGFVFAHRGGVPRTGPHHGAAGRVGRSGGARTPPPPVFNNSFAGRSAGQVSTMILPQVHLRKPCYDFSFL